MKLQLGQFDHWSQDTAQAPGSLSPSRRLALAIAAKAEKQAATPRTLVHKADGSSSFMPAGLSQGSKFDVTAPGLPTVMKQNQLSPLESDANGKPVAPRAPDGQPLSARGRPKGRRLSRKSSDSAGTESNHEDADTEHSTGNSRSHQKKSHKRTSSCDGAHEPTAPVADNQGKHGRRSSRKHIHERPPSPQPFEDNTNNESPGKDPEASKLPQEVPPSPTSSASLISAAAPDKSRELAFLQTSSRAADVSLSFDFSDDCGVNGDQDQIMDRAVLESQIRADLSGRWIKKETSKFVAEISDCGVLTWYTGAKVTLQVSDGFVVMQCGKDDECHKAVLDGSTLHWSDDDVWIKSNEPCAPPSRPEGTPSRPQKERPAGMFGRRLSKMSSASSDPGDSDGVEAGLSEQAAALIADTGVTKMQMFFELGGSWLKQSTGKPIAQITKAGTLTWYTGTESKLDVEEDRSSEGAKVVLMFQHTRHTAVSEDGGNLLRWDDGDVWVKDNSANQDATPGLPKQEPETCTESDFQEVTSIRHTQQPSDSGVQQSESKEPASDMIIVSNPYVTQNLQPPDSNADALVEALENLGFPLAQALDAAQCCASVEACVDYILNNEVEENAY
eukprot:gnl/MRDRNA2_/MRDRNA2_63873_c0_seq1.p1 gnl/MRDRNA2_/MRDRNA2_63873_c0~~gnl/MRDRNA2_/MRDRNA2_63873_c0_seq1.p1  ORF type:complete len:616 (-),score=125.28 gnl/MRDRNA2_/MRDRNA2_63873_c0_seq1:173-2020(-)